jgi:hypothetical protein
MPTSGSVVGLSICKEKLFGLINLLKKNCLDNEPKIVAFSISLGFCIGIVPFIGFTLITITALGGLFKLNQLILQITHILVSPLQIILLPVFLKIGNVIFHQPDYNIATISNEFVHSNVFTVLQHFGSIVFYGLIVWLGFSIFLGLILYRILLILLRPKAKLDIYPSNDIKSSCLAVTQEVGVNFLSGPDNLTFPK